MGPADVEGATTQLAKGRGGRAALITLTPQAARRFKATTRVHSGERLARVIDGRILSAPFIREPIAGGTPKVAGGLGFLETARALSDAASAGPLPVDLVVFEERALSKETGLAARVQPALQ